MLVEGRSDLGHGGLLAGGGVGQQAHPPHPYFRRGGRFAAPNEEFCRDERGGLEGPPTEVATISPEQRLGSRRSVLSASTRGDDA